MARKALTVAIVDDTVNEAAESFEWVLSAGAGEATGFDGDGARLSVARVTIEDDDAAPAWAVAVEPERIEEGESATVKVESTTGSAFAEERVVTLRFGGNATEGSDYTVGSRSLTIAAGARESGSVTLTSIDDEGDEPDETVVVIAELDGGVIGRRSLVLEDNDEAPNVAAAGAPVISGRAHAGRTLMADTSGIADEDGLGNVEYEYQWIRGDDEISEATGSAYELTDADVGTSVRVRVTFNGRPGPRGDAGERGGGGDGGAGGDGGRERGRDNRRGRRAGDVLRVPVLERLGGRRGRRFRGVPAGAVGGVCRENRTRPMRT